MSNQANQNQSTERAIYLKDLHQWVPVSKTDYDNYYRDINAYRRRQQEHGRCVCPASKRYLCDMDCWTCRFRKAGDELSLDYTITDEDGNEKSWSFFIRQKTHNFLFWFCITIGGNDENLALLQR